MAKKKPQKRAPAKAAKPARPRRPATKKTVPSPTVELSVMDVSTASLIPADKHASLIAWCELYLTVEGAAGSEKTFQDKTSDLKQFLNYFLQAAATDHVDQWTRSVTGRYLTHMARKLGRKPNTINRHLATLKTVAKWIHKQRPFLAGNPTARIKELQESEPDWQGLTPLQLTRVMSAAEQLVHLQRRKNQRPHRNYAIFVVLLNTGLRISELLALDLDQYRGKHFERVKRKGKMTTRKVFLNSEAREALDRYLEQERGTKAGPLLCTLKGTRLDRFTVDDILKAVQNQANAKLPEAEKFYWSAHTLRHTYLRDIANTHGVHRAKEVAGHVSDRYIWRYVKPDDAEIQEMNENVYSAAQPRQHS